MAESNSNNQSHPMSEYDFAEASDETSEPDFQVDIAVLKMDQHVRLVLRNYQLSQEVLEQFAIRNVKFDQLASLSKEDLEMLGVADEEVRDRMLRDFIAFDGQVPNYEEVLLKFRNLREAEYRGKSVIDQIQHQLLSMNTLLAATIIKVGANQSSQSPGIVVNSSFNSPQLVLEMLRKLATHTDEMKDLLLIFKNQSEMDAAKEAHEKKAARRRNIIGSIAAACVVIGYIVAIKLRASK